MNYKNTRSVETELFLWLKLKRLTTLCINRMRRRPVEKKKENNGVDFFFQVSFFLLAVKVLFHEHRIKKLELCTCKEHPLFVTKRKQKKFDISHKSKF